MVCRVEIIGIHAGQVLDLKLDESGGQFGLVAEIKSKLVWTQLLAMVWERARDGQHKHTGFEFEFARHDVHEELDNGVGSAKDLVEQHETNQHWLFLCESESIIERLVADEGREQREYVEDMELTDRQQLRCVRHAPVAQLVCQNCFHLFLGALFQEGVVDDNLLLPWEAGEVGIAVGASLAAIDNLEFAEWELELACQCIDTSLECSLLEWLEFVE